MRESSFSRGLDSRRAPFDALLLGLELVLQFLLGVLRAACGARLVPARRCSLPAEGVVARRGGPGVGAQRLQPSCARTIINDRAAARSVAHRGAAAHHGCCSPTSSRAATSSRSPTHEQGTACSALQVVGNGRSRLCSVNAWLSHHPLASASRRARPAASNGRAARIATPYRSRRVVYRGGREAINVGHLVLPDILALARVVGKRAPEHVAHLVGGDALESRSGQHRSTHPVDRRKRPRRRMPRIVVMITLPADHVHRPRGGRRRAVVARLATRTEQEIADVLTGTAETPAAMTAGAAWRSRADEGRSPRGSGGTTSEPPYQLRGR